MLEVLFWGTLVVALLLRSWWALLLFPTGLALWSFAIGSLFPLKATQRTEVLSARRTAAFQIVIAAALIAGAYFLWGSR